MPTPMVGDGDATMAALPAPHTDVDALPYVDRQYNDPALKAQVDAMIEAELKTFKPSRDYLAHLPELHEPNFDDHPLLQAEWMRVCEEQPMSKMDTSRWRIAPSPAANHPRPPIAWTRCLSGTSSTAHLLRGKPTSRRGGAP